jgi:hypothetical protein
LTTALGALSGTLDEILNGRGLTFDNPAAPVVKLGSGTAAEVPALSSSSASPRSRTRTWMRQKVRDQAPPKRSR